MQVYSYHCLVNVTVIFYKTTHTSSYASVDESIKGFLLKTDLNMEEVFACFKFSYWAKIIQSLVQVLNLLRQTMSEKTVD